MFKQNKTTENRPTDEEAQLLLRGIKTLWSSPKKRRRDEQGEPNSNHRKKKRIFEETSVDILSDKFQRLDYWCDRFWVLSKLQSTNKDHTYRPLYKMIQRLLQIKKEGYENNVALSLLCQDDDVAFFEEKLHFDDYLWLLLAVYAHADKIALRFLEKMETFLEEKNVMRILYEAVYSGNIRLFDYLLDTYVGSGIPIMYQLKLSVVMSKSLRIALAGGSLEMVKHLLNKFHLDFKSLGDPLLFAIESGNLELISFLLKEKKYFPGQQHIVRAATTGESAVLGLLLDYLRIDLAKTFSFDPIGKQAFIRTVSRVCSDVSLMENIYDRLEFRHYDPEFFYQICLSPHIEVVRHFLETEQYGFDLDNYLVWMDINRRIPFSFKYTEVAEYLMERIKTRYKSGSMLLEAVSLGCENMVNHLLDPENGFNLVVNQNLLTYAATIGKPGILKLLVSLGRLSDVEPNQETLNAATGNLITLQYLITECRLEPNQETLSGALKKGCLESAEYLLDPRNGFSVGMLEPFTLSEEPPVNNLSLLPKKLSFEYHPVILASRQGSVVSKTVPVSSHKEIKNQFMLALCNCHYYVNLACLATSQEASQEAFSLAYGMSAMYFCQYVEAVLTSERARKSLGEDAFNALIGLEFVTSLPVSSYAAECLGQFQDAANQSDRNEVHELSRSFGRRC